jgi:hypothetical protein
MPLPGTHRGSVYSSRSSAVVGLADRLGSSSVGQINADGELRSGIEVRQWPKPLQEEAVEGFDLLQG